MSETVQADGWLLCLAVDITPLRQDSRVLAPGPCQGGARGSQTDALTGLANRRQGLQLLAAGAGLSPNPGRCASPCWTWTISSRSTTALGHAAGDEVLRDFARQMLASTRREDGCARMGGEEFLLILPAAALGQAGVIVERLLARVRQSRPLAAQPEFGYRCSAGLVEAQWGEGSEALAAARRCDAVPSQGRRSRPGRTRRTLSLKRARRCASADDAQLGAHPGLGRRPGFRTRRTARPCSA